MMEVLHNSAFEINYIFLSSLVQVNTPFENTFNVDGKIKE